MSAAANLLGHRPPPRASSLTRKSTRVCHGTGSRPCRSLDSRGNGFAVAQGPPL